MNLAYHENVSKVSPVLFVSTIGKLLSQSILELGASGVLFARTYCHDNLW